MFACNPQSSLGSGGDLNRDDVQVHAVVVIQATIGNSDGTIVAVVQGSGIHTTNGLGRGVIIDAQSADGGIQHLCNLTNSSSLANNTVNSKQHGDSLGANFL